MPEGRGRSLSVASRLRYHQCMTAATTAEPAYDEIAVAQVVEDGHRLKLRGADLREAIRRMAASGRFTQPEAADALGLKPNTLSVYASRLGARFPSGVEPQHWTVAYMYPSAGKPHKRRVSS